MTMFNVHRREFDFAGRTMTLETGKVARQADGCVIATYGETTVMATVVGEKSPREGIDFFPLSVHYQEKAFAAGKIPGGFFKREGRPSEKETLVSRLIDRPIRPLFHPLYRNETQVLLTVLCHDLENDPDVVAMIAASAALTVSGIPFLGPIGGARVGLINGELVVNPTVQQMEDSTLDLVVAGTTEGVLMVESEAEQLSEEMMLDAVMTGWRAFQAPINAIISLAESCAKAPWPLPEPAFDVDAVKAQMKDLVGEAVRQAYTIQIKQDRQAAVSAAKQTAVEQMASETLPPEVLSGVFKKLESDIVRGQILDTGSRIDGRTTVDVRPIEAEVGILPRAHGSALFTRGETQALVVATLGTGQDEQIIDSLGGEYREPFLLHYNFPPYSVGETGRVGSPGRREIGHGKLAWRALHPMLPSREEFPYTVRVVSEITESNGSSSMASVCGGSLAMMDAGVPMKAATAGIAMGLIKEGERFAVLSDILGDEDHLGDMDFKVAGSAEGITSLQMDIKITSITEEIMKVALAQAKDGRLHILGRMAEAITSGREELSAHAPRIHSFKINPEKLRDVIGSGGKVIREICEVTGCKIDLEDDGTVKVASSSGEAIQKAVDWIQGIAAEPELNKIYKGKVVKIMEFGAFVNFLGARDGLVHVSQLTEGRVKNVSDVVSEGQEVMVKVVGFDPRGKVKLSMVNIDQQTGEETGAAAE